MSLQCTENPVKKLASPPHDYLSDEIMMNPEKREFPAFDVVRLLGTVFEPTQGCRVCILTDFKDPKKWMKDFAFLETEDKLFGVQKNAVKHFYQPFIEGVMDELGMYGGEMFAYYSTNGSNLDMKDDVFDSAGNHLSLDKDIYSEYDIVLCITDWSATAPLTAKCKEFNFRGATMHGMNDVILNSGLAVDYNLVAADAEKMRAAMTKADSIEVDFTLEDGKVLTAWLGLDGQEAQKSQGLCKGMKPDVANLPAGEVYFVPTDARGEFPMKYEDGTLGLLTVKDRSIIKSSLIEGNQKTIDNHNARLGDDAMTGTIGELGFGTQILPVSFSDIQDEKVIGTCHLATGRDDHLGGDIIPEMFKIHENSTHDDILFAPHKTPNFNISEVRMYRGGKTEVIIENFRPSEFVKKALRS
ncbi:MAG: aminopeptidase [Rubritalea sp.]|jgi:aminopeptidase|tara:strand:+ start:28619 stop:29857 length:1239 start_codon:yes stop_codon:yes gene_type:complete